MEIRELTESDYYRKYLSLLAELTLCDNVSASDFSVRLKKIKSNPLHKIYVMEDNKQIIATITVLIEPKFIRGLNSVAHIEDFVVAKSHRKLGLGKKLLDHAISYAHEHNCYKVILNCSKDMLEFYQKKGFTAENYEMSYRFI